MPHRLFIAIRPPTVVCEQLLDTMEGLDAARWQDDEHLHLTLRFVGEVEHQAAEDLAAALAAISWAPFKVSLDGVSHFARRGRATAIWARVVPTPELAGLRAKVERACTGTGLGDETRRFTPHVTLARLGRGAGPLGPWLARHGGLRAEWQAESFELIESRLLPAGAHYETAARYPLRA